MKNRTLKFNAFTRIEFSPHHLQEGFGIEGRQVTAFRLPSPVEIVGIRPAIPWTILRLRDDGQLSFVYKGGELSSTHAPANKWYVSSGHS